MADGRSSRKVRRTGWHVALALLPAFILGIYARHPDLSWLSFIALVPWIVLYTDDRKPKVSIGYFLLGAWATWAMAYYFLYGFGWFVPPLLAALYVVPWIPFAPILRRLHHRLRLPRTLAVPLVWVAVEWLRTESSVGHVEFWLLGYSQAALKPLIQIADLTGVYGVSWLVAAVNGLLVDLHFAFRDARWSPKRVLSDRRVAATAGLVVMLWTGAWVYGAVRLARARSEPGPRLAIVQPNVLHTLSNLLGVHLSHVILTEERVPAGAADVVVWPENAIVGDLRRVGYYLADVKWLGEKKGAWFLVGGRDFPLEHPGRTRNSAFLINDRGEIVGQHDKVVLVPWSEYVPFDALLQRTVPAVQRVHRGLVRRAWGFLAPGLPGRRMTTMRLPWEGGELPFSVLICGENYYPPLATAASRSGARFLVNITSEGELGAAIQTQLLRISIFRAVENRIACVRLGNTGISCFVDSAGRIVSLLKGDRGRAIADTGVLIDEVPLSHGGPTVYARSSDAFAKVCALVALLLLGRSWLRSRGDTSGIGAEPVSERA